MSAVTSRMLSAFQGQGGFTTQLFGRLRNTLDASVLEAGAKSELLVARARLAVVGLVLLLQLLPAWNEGLRSVALPGTLLTLAYAASVHELARRRYRPSLGLFTSLVDVCLVTALLLGYGLRVDLHLLTNSWSAFELYFVVIALATLRFNWLVCALTGLAALAQYGLVVVWMLPLAALDAQSAGPFPYGRFQLNSQLCRLALLLVATLVGMLVVVQASVLRKHLAESLQRRQEQERRQEQRVAEERERLSRDLHDAVAQMLFGVALVAQSVGPAYRREAREGERQVQRLLDLAQKTLGDMRTLIAQVCPDQPVPELVSAQAALNGVARLQELGLSQALRQLGREICGESPWVDLDESRYEPQSLQVEEVLYRIAKEALSNVVRHARARFVSMALVSQEGVVVLTVSDDGAGFDADEVLQEVWSGPHALRGYGLLSVRERVLALRGLLRVVSRPGEGATLRVTIPTGTEPRIEALG